METRKNINLLKIYKKPLNYGLFYHYFLINEKEGIEIHTGEFEKNRIRPIKRSKTAIYLGLQFLCDDCYEIRKKLIPFSIFPMINCETVIMNRVSFQMFGIYAICFSVILTLVYNNLWPLIFLILIIYMFCNRYMSKAQIYSCKHVSEDEIKKIIEENESIVKNISLLN